MDRAYQQCALDVGINASVAELLRCLYDSANTTTVTTPTDDSSEDAYEFSRTVFLVFSATLVVFMQAGFAMVCAGCVRKKNVQNTLLKNLLDACGASIAYFSIGYAFSYGDMDPGNAQKRFIGLSHFFLMEVDDLAFFLFQFSFSASCATIVAGCLAERSQMVAYLLYSMVLTGFVYPVVVHAVWNSRGFLSDRAVHPFLGVGMVDFAGGSVVHVTGGLVAVIATYVLGPRRGRFHDENGRKLTKPRDFPGHSASLQMLGSFILWFGWYGFNVGSALILRSPRLGRVAALAAVNSTLAGGSGCISSLFLNFRLTERRTGEPYFDLKFAMNGALAGLAAVTGGCGVMEPWAASITGLIAGIFYVGGSYALVNLRIDDAVDAIPVHLVGGFWGIVSVGFFAAPKRLFDAYGRADHVGLFYSFRRGSSDATLLAAQVVGLCFIFGWIICTMLPFFLWMDWSGWLRSDPLEEIVGLDTTYHGGLVLVADDDINPEYITAFRRQRDERQLRRRQKSRGPPASSIIVEVNEPEVEPRAVDTRPQSQQSSDGEIQMFDSGQR